MLLAVAMTVAFASSVMAADLSWWMGGDFYYFYTTETKGLQDASGIFTVDSILTAQITEGNSWAKMWYVNDTWNFSRDGNNSLYYAFGYNKIGDVLDLGFSTKDTGICNIGQNPLGEFFNDFKADPVFNTYDMPNAASAVINLDNVTLKAEYVTRFANGWNDEAFAFAGIVKIDSGDVHFGYKRLNSGNDAYLMNLGAAFTVGSAAVKVDLYNEPEGQAIVWGSAANTGTYGEVGAYTGLSFQANVAFEKFDVTLFYNDADATNDDMLGLGANFKVSDKLTFGAKMFQDSPNMGDVWEVYGLYDVGAFDIKFGILDNDVDTMGILGFHASIW